MYFKFQNNKSPFPDWLFSLPTVREVRDEPVVTRSDNNLFVPRTATDTGANAFSVRGPRAGVSV